MVEQPEQNQEEIEMTMEDTASAVLESLKEQEAEELLASSEEAPANGVSKEQGGKEPETAPISPEAARNADGTPATESPAQQEASDKTPSSWSAEDKAVFAQLTPEVQDVVLRREQERDKALNDKFMKIAEQGRAYSELDQLYESKGKDFQQYGTTPVAATKELFALFDYAKEDPAGYIQYFAKNFGVDLNSLINGQPAGEGQPMAQTDPVVRQLTQQLESLQTTVSTQQQEQQQQILADAQSEIETFSKNPDNKHFDAVRDSMSQIMATKQANNLQEAYEMAIWLNPTIRDGLITEKHKAQESERVTEKAEAAKDARKKQGTAIKGRKVSGGSSKKLTMEETAKAVYDELHAEG